MSRFARTVLCSAGTLALCLVALPLVSKGQEVTIDSQGGSVTTAPPRASSPSPSLVKPGPPIPEGTVTIYSNFGSAGNLYDCCHGWTESGPASGVGSWLQAMAFTPIKGTYVLTQLDLAVAWVEGTNGYELELDADDHGQPGGEIAKWPITGLPTFGTCCTVETIRFFEPASTQGPIILEKDHQYWLVPIVNSSGWASWNFNSLSVSGNGAYSTDGGSTWTTLRRTNGAFDVLGLKTSCESGAEDELQPGRLRAFQASAKGAAPARAVRRSIVGPVEHRAF